MTFEDRINLLVVNDFYLHRACSYFGSNRIPCNDRVRMTRLYVGDSG